MKQNGIPSVDLNDFISDGKKTWRLVRNRLAEIFDENNPKLRDNKDHREVVIFKVEEIEMLLPVQTDEDNVSMSLELPPLPFGHTFQHILHLLTASWCSLPIYSLHTTFHQLWQKCYRTHHKANEKNQQ